MEAIVLAVLAFLGVTLVVYGAFGRPDQNRPRCTRCGVDVRPFAWDAPRRVHVAHS
ncbi:MAG: hypothetical protein SGJ09_17410 [Phycisphaerae bacterium]|nr:hypothetical protein [Phycisphaerae bacterium]